MAKKFLRRDSVRYSKLGKKKKQKWKKPAGRDNKMREKRRGYPKVVSIGYKKEKKLRKSAVIVKNVKDLETMKKDNIIIIGKVGKKKKIEIAKKAKELKIKIRNLNVEKFLKKIGKIAEAKASGDKKKVVKGKTKDKVEQSSKKDEKLITKKITANKSEQVNKEEKNEIK